MLRRRQLLFDSRHRQEELQRMVTTKIILVKNHAPTVVNVTNPFWMKSSFLPKLKQRE